MVHNFKDWPELTNTQMQFYYFQSPHKQITEDFVAKVVDVHDGDTIKLRWRERDFDFPLRFLGIAAPELKEKGGPASQSWLESQILGKTVNIAIDPFNRVGKWGRILGEVFHIGMNIGVMSMDTGHSVPFEKREVIPWA